MTFTTQGLIIREQFTGESDRIVTALTKDLGIVRAFASGARSFKSKNIAATQLLCFSSLSLSKRKDTYRITESKPIEVFFELRNDISKLSLAQYFCEAVRAFAPEEEECAQMLRLVLNCLKFLCGDKKSELQIKTVFELRLLCLSGYMPDLSCCGSCGKSDGEYFYFSPSDGCIYCENCSVESSEKITPAMLGAARHICYGDFERIFSYRLDEQSTKELAKISEKYMIAQAERKFATLDFYRSL
ncbi:MAG: DNA repair protein RecO [Acutalibacteraceae bacterium]